MHSRIMARRFDHYSTITESDQSYKDKRNYNNKVYGGSNDNIYGTKQPFGPNSKRYQFGMQGSNPRASNHSINPRHKSQPPVACYPVNMSVDDGAGEDYGGMTSTNNNNFNHNHSSVRLNSGYQRNYIINPSVTGDGNTRQYRAPQPKKFTSPVVYNRFNYTRPKTMISNNTMANTKTDEQPSAINLKPVNTQKFTKAKCNFDESEFPKIDNGRVVEEKAVPPKETYNNAPPQNLNDKNDKYMKYEKNLKNVENEKEEKRDVKKEEKKEELTVNSTEHLNTKKEDNTEEEQPTNVFPFPTAVQDIYIHMYNHYISYEKAMLKTIASQNKITISSNDNHKVFSDEDIKKYLYMLFTQSFGSFIQCMNKNSNSVLLDEKTENVKFTNASTQTDENHTPAVDNTQVNVNKENGLKGNTLQKASTNMDNVLIVNEDTHYSKRRPSGSEIIYKPPHIRDRHLYEENPVSSVDVTTHLIDNTQSGTSSNVTKKSHQHFTSGRRSENIPPKPSMVLSSTGTVKITINNQDLTRHPNKR